MTYVFGDIHGCMTSFETLLSFLEPGPGDTVITLGDYIDRGPASKAVIERLLGLKKECQLVALRGNHEAMMKEARQGPPASSFWLLNGGIETLESYQCRSLAEVDQHHWDFLASLKRFHLIEPFFFAHATPPPKGTPADYTYEELLWPRFRKPKARKDGRFLICGHTPQEDRRPALHNGHLCLDTGCAHGGFLTALTLETGEYLQASENGEIRDGSLALPALKTPS